MFPTSNRQFETIYYPKSKVPSYEPMNIKFSHRLYTQILRVEYHDEEKMSWMETDIPERVYFYPKGCAVSR